MSPSALNAATVKQHSVLLWRLVIVTGTLILLLIAAPACRQRPSAQTTPQMDAQPAYWVRVLLLQATKQCRVTTPGPLLIKPRAVSTATPSEPIKLSTAEKPILIRIQDGYVLIGPEKFAADELTLYCPPTHVLTVNGQAFRGKLTLIVSPDDQTFDLINEVPLEPYLAGVVGAEMPAYWEPQALRAQTIAARTYCLYIKKRFGTRRRWDVSRTEAHQVYQGLAAESPQIWDAVHQTTGQVLVCKGPDGEEDLFPTYYSSTCGGHTENAENVFGDRLAPLRGVPCPYCKKVAKPNLFFWPMVQIQKQHATQKLLQRYPNLKQLGTITAIEVARKSTYPHFSRLTKIALVGSNGQRLFLRAEDLRLTLDPTGRKIRSTSCEITDLPDYWTFAFGRGYGHGVGLCQCGAQAMARQGKNAQQILAYYYPTARIKKLY